MFKKKNQQPKRKLDINIHKYMRIPDGIIQTN